jgi:hypothetical protein
MEDLMKKFSMILVLLALAMFAFGRAGGAGGGGAHSSPSGGRASSVRAPLSNSYKAPSTNVYRAPTVAHVTVNNHYYEAAPRSYSYGGYYYRSNYVDGVVTGMMLSTLWNHPRTTVIVVGDQSFQQYQTGYIDTSGRFYETLPVRADADDSVQAPVNRASDGVFNLAAIVIGVIFLGAIVFGLIWSIVSWLRNR